MAAALWFKTFLLLSLLIIFMPNYSGMVEGFEDHGMQALEQGGISMMIPMSSSARRLLMGAMLDYDDTGPNPKHDPRKKPGKP